MLSYVVRCFTWDKGLSKLTGEMHPRNKLLTSTIACDSHRDAQEVVDSLQGVRETELCVSFYSDNRPIILPFDEFHRAVNQFNRDCRDYRDTNKEIGAREIIEHEARYFEELEERAAQATGNDYNADLRTPIVTRVL